MDQVARFPRRRGRSRRSRKNKGMQMLSSPSPSPPPSPSPSKDSSESERDNRWSDLLPELLGLISEKITDISDYIHFRAVCQSWRSAATTTEFLKTHQLPWLMLAHVSDPRSTTCSFFSLAANMVYSIDLPELQGSGKNIICGSSQGWLVVLDVTNTLEAAAFLLNPLTRAQIQLPQPNDIPHQLGYNLEPLGEEEEDGTKSWLDIEAYTRKAYLHIVTLSSSPSSSEECMVIAQIDESHKFAFCRIGDGGWTVQDSNLPYPVSSLAYHDTRFYVVDKMGNTAICFPDSSSSSSSNKVSFTATLIPSLKLPINYICHSHVVDSGGELLIVAWNRNYLELQDPAYNLRTFRLDVGSGQLRWSEVRSMGNNHSLFFSHYNFSSIASSTSYQGLAITNWIYFTTPLTILAAQDGWFKIDRSAAPDLHIYRSTIHDNQVVRDTRFEPIINDWDQPFTTYWFTPTF